MSQLPNFQSLSEDKEKQEPYVLHYKGENIITANGMGKIVWDQYGNKFQWIPQGGILPQMLILEKVQPGLQNYNEILNRAYIIDIYSSYFSSNPYISVCGIASHCFDGITSPQPIFIDISELLQFGALICKNFHGDICISFSKQFSDELLANIDLILYQSTGNLYIDHSIQDTLYRVGVLEKRDGVLYLKNTNMAIHDPDEFITTISFDTLQLVKGSITYPNGGILGTHGIGDTTMILNNTATMGFAVGNGFSSNTSQRILFTKDSKVKDGETLIPITKIVNIAPVQFPYLPSTIQVIQGFSKFSIGTMDITSCNLTAETVLGFFSSSLNEGTIQTGCFQLSDGTLLVTTNQYQIMDDAGLLEDSLDEEGRKKFTNSNYVLVQIKDGSL